MPPRIPDITPVICGPTAGGKSDLAVGLSLALREGFSIDAEIIAADALQVYRGMDIGTAKPTAAERRGVVHHLVDLVEPNQRTPNVSEGPGTPRASDAQQPVANTPGSLSPFTVDDWLRLAHQAIADIRTRGGLPIVVGGTHLYIKALLDGLFDGPEPDPALRVALHAMDPAARRAELERADPAAAARIHPNDVRRTVRALEVFRLTGRAISDMQGQWDRRQHGEGNDRGSRKSPSGSQSLATSSAGGGSVDDAPGSFRLVVLDWEVEALNNRINARVKNMMDRGLLDELRALVAPGPLAAQPAEALGYKQLLPVLDGRMALDNAVEQIKIQTRRFAKNQRTWMRRLRMTPGALTIPMPTTTPEQAVGLVIKRLDLPKSR